MKPPLLRAGVYAAFGNPGKGAADPSWVKANIVECHGKGAMPGVPEKFYFQCHHLVEPIMRDAFTAALGTYKIDRAASFVFRHQRHDPARPLSYHSWGIAVDVNTADNKAREVSRTLEPWSAEWLRLWPRGVTPGFVAAFESRGFRWGGRWRRFCDPMHFEFVRVK